MGNFAVHLGGRFQVDDQGQPQGGQQAKGGQEADGPQVAPGHEVVKGIGKALPQAVALGFASDDCPGVLPGVGQVIERRPVKPPGSGCYHGDGKRPLEGALGLPAPRAQGLMGEPGQAWQQPGQGQPFPSLPVGIAHQAPAHQRLIDQLQADQGQAGAEGTEHIPCQRQGHRPHDAVPQAQADGIDHQVKAVHVVAGPQHQQIQRQQLKPRFNQQADERKGGLGIALKGA